MQYSRIRRIALSRLPVGSFSFKRLSFFDYRVRATEQIKGQRNLAVTLCLCWWRGVSGLQKRDIVAASFQAWRLRDSVAKLGYRGAAAMPHQMRLICRGQTDRLSCLANLKALSVEVVFSEEALEGSSLFTGSVRGVGNVALMAGQKI